MTAAPARWFVYILIIIGALLNIPAYRWRRIGSAFIYIELMIRTAVILIPNSKVYQSNENTYMIEIVGFTTGLYCGDKYSAYLMILSYIWQIFGTRVAYLKPLGIGAILYLILTILITTLAFSLIISSIYHMTKLHSLVDFTNKENKKLLHRMHEGLIVVNKPKKLTTKRKIMFCNRPAQKLTDLYIKSHKKADIFTTPTFVPINMKGQQGPTFVSPPNEK